LRGQKVLFENILEEDSIQEEGRKGRSAELDTKRNQMIAARYYFYLTFTDKRYDSILKRLSDEIYLAERTISNILQEPENMQYIRQLKNQKPSVEFFQENWRQFQWISL
jgi:hypothetical protein